MIIIFYTKKKRIDYILSKLYLNYSRSLFKYFIIKGFIKINKKKILKPNFKLKGGEKITIFNSNILNNKNDIFYNLNLNIIYEDNFILVINKNYNLIVHPGNKNYNKTLFNTILYYYPNNLNIPRAGIIHRLDKNTTGLIIIAKTKKAYINLVKLFKKKKIIREYDGIVNGIINNWKLIDKSIYIKKKNIKINLNSKKAFTYYKILTNFRFHTWIKFKLKTGRTHQIRIHMYNIKKPLIGDQIYNYKNYKNKYISPKLIYILNNFKRQALHASFLEFIHPILKCKIKLYSPLPYDFKILLRNLKLDNEIK